MKLTKLEFVRGIQAVLSDESKWCKGDAAKTAAGLSTHLSDPAAASFCVYGAARKATNFSFADGIDSEQFWEVLQDIGNYDRRKISSGSIGFWNDSHSYFEIMEKLREIEAKYAAEEAKKVPDAVSV